MRVCELVNWKRCEVVGSLCARKCFGELMRRCGVLEKDYELARGSGELMSWEKMWSSQAAYECKKCKPPSSSQLVGYWLQVARFNNS